MSDGSVEVTMAIPLDGVGGLNDQLLSTMIGAKPSITAFEGTKGPKSMVFSGLIIDCRGLHVKPALAPKIVDEEGREIYGSAYVTRRLGHQVRASSAMRKMLGQQRNSTGLENTRPDQGP